MLTLFSLTCETKIPMSVLGGMDSLEVDTMIQIHAARKIHFMERLRSIYEEAGNLGADVAAARILHLIAEERLSL